MLTEIPKDLKAFWTEVILTILVIDKLMIHTIIKRNINTTLSRNLLCFFTQYAFFLTYYMFVRSGLPRPWGGFASRGSLVQSFSAKSHGLWSFWYEDLIHLLSKSIGVCTAKARFNLKANFKSWL